MNIVYYILFDMLFYFIYLVQSHSEHTRCVILQCWLKNLLRCGIYSPSCGSKYLSRWWQLLCSASTERAGSRWHRSTLRPKRTREVGRWGPSTHIIRWTGTENLHISIHKISITPSLWSENPVILKLNAQTSICFRRREDSKIGGQQSSSMGKPFGSTLSLASWASRHWLWSNPPIQWFSWTGTAQWNACASRHAGSHKIFK